MDSDEIFEKFDRVVGGRLKSAKPKTSSRTVPQGNTVQRDVAPESSKPSEIPMIAVPMKAENDGHVQQSESTTGIDQTDNGVVPVTDGNESTVTDTNRTQKTWIPELMKIIQFKDLRNNVRVVPAENFKAQKRRSDKELDGPYKNRSIVLRKILGVDLGLRDYRLEIQSESLRKLFKEIGRPYRELNLEAVPILIRHPFRCLFFLRDKIKELSADPETPLATRAELVELLSFINSEPALQNLIAMYDEMVPRRKITPALKWTLFRPHEWIYIRYRVNNYTEHIAEHCGVVSRIETTFNSTTGRKAYKIVYVTGHHDGSKYGLRESFTMLESDSQELLDISTDNLNTIPMRFIPEEERENIRLRLIKRGKRYVHLSEIPFRMMHYNGPISVTSESSDRFLGDFGGSTDGFNVNWQADQRVIVDKQAQHDLSSIEEVGDQAIISPSIHEYLNRGVEENEEVSNDDAISVNSISDVSSTASEVLDAMRKALRIRRANAVRWKDVPISDEDYLLCPSALVAFLLREKIWVGRVLIDYLSDIEWKTDPYLFLQLPEDKKILIKSLVRGFGIQQSSPQPQHQEGQQGSGSSEEVFDDIIEGKGRGLIFLLHGPPGLGKTLTAESVAESTRRPLYHVSTGELSADVEKLERQLSEIFRLGLRWGAVVLLDEADVLMTRRSSNELQRNAIVAVFLRMLEYYNGMLFLTTNRFEDFDDAFYNRIHVNVKYDRLQGPERANIWRQHLTRACKRNKQQEPWDEEVYEALGRIESNGRDIRNYTRTAYGFATALEEDLNIGHLVTVIRNNLNRENSELVEKVFAELESMGRRIGKRPEAQNADFKAGETKGETIVG